MKSIVILIMSALASTAIASANHAPLQIHQLKDLAARSIDPMTMDPTKLSVLSVLKTAVPSGLEPRPTGDVEPEWYQHLPEDVKSLLPELYPAAGSGAIIFSGSATSAPSSTTANLTATITSTITSKITLTKSLEQAPSHTAGLGNHTHSNTTANRTMGSTPLETSSLGAKTAVRMEILAALIWVVVGAAFFLFA